MNRSNVRIGIFSTGVISGLLLLLYLPALIWSPPWGENGYYTFDQSSSFHVVLYFKNGNITNSAYNLDNSIMKKGTLKYINDKSNKEIWLNTKDSALKIRFNKGQLVWGINAENIDGTHTNKTSNPFTLWHIKWLEWTADSP